MKIKILLLIGVGVIVQQPLYGFVSAQKSLEWVRLIKTVARPLKKDAQQEKISEKDKLQLFQDFILVEGGCAYDRMNKVQDAAWLSFKGFRTAMENGSLFNVLYQDILSTIRSFSNEEKSVQEINNYFERVRSQLQARNFDGAVTTFLSHPPIPRQMLQEYQKLGDDVLEKLGSNLFRYGDHIKVVKQVMGNIVKQTEASK